MAALACGGPGSGLSATAARRARRRRVWHAAVRATRIDRDVFLVHHALVLSPLRVVPIQTLYSDAGALPDESTFGKTTTATEPTAYSEASAPPDVQVSEGRVFDDVTADWESLRRMFSCVQDACLAAMPYEVVAANAGTEKSREHEASLKSEMCKAADIVPAEFKGPFLEHVDVLVSGVMEAARKEKLQIGSLIQTKWRTMTPQEKRPWEHLYEQKSNVGPSPFYLWLQDAMREEWARRRGNVPQSTS